MKDQDRDLIRRAHNALRQINKGINEHPHAYFVDKEQFEERVQWCRDNIQGEWFPIELAGMCSIRFKEEKDAMFYKLTWK